MPQLHVNERFLQTTRGRIAGLLRAGPRTVEELALALELTDNAIRAHLSTLERDGLVRSAGVRRTAGVGKPAVLYELPPEGDLIFSRAYPPVLQAVLDEIVARLPSGEAHALLTAAGKRLAESLRPPPDATPRERLLAGVEVLNALGGSAVLEETDSTVRIRGCGCPLGSAVARRPETCCAVEALLTEVIGQRVQQCCDHGERPSCCFSVSPSV